MSLKIENIPASDELLDLMHGKQVALRTMRGNLNLNIPMDVFSSHEVDRGTLTLLREMEKAGAPQGDWLDVGCGYGPIALATISNGWARHATGLERDALSLDFSRRNARLNNINETKWIGGIAYPRTLKQYDSVAMNLPAKAGESVHRLMLHGCFAYLKPEGHVWIVIVSPLKKHILAMLSKPEVKLLNFQETADYCVMQYRFKKQPAVPEKPYLRTIENFELNGVSYPLNIAHGLNEFDRISYETELLIEIFDKNNGRQTEHIVIADNGPGHLAMWCVNACKKLRTLRLVSRDALAISQAAENLDSGEVQMNIRMLHCVDFSASAQSECDWLLVKLNEKEGIDAALWRIRRCMSKNVCLNIALVCGAGFGGRLEKLLRRENFHLRYKKKSKGLWAAMLNR